MNLKSKVNSVWWVYLVLLGLWSFLTPVIHGWLPTVVTGWRFDFLTVMVKAIPWTVLTWWGCRVFRDQLTDQPRQLWHLQLTKVFWISLLVLIGIQSVGQSWQAQPFRLNPNLLTRENGQLLNVTLAAGLFEEWFFRGFLTNSLLKTGPFWRVNLAQAVAFQVIHFPLYLVAGYSSLIWLGNIACVFPLGLLFGWNYQRSHSIWPSMFLHIAWNSMVFLFN